MRKSRKLSAVAALGSLTAAVALLAGSPASAQTAPGGGSFPGSLLVPGTNTSIKVGGFAKVVGIYDISGGKNGDTVAVDGIPLRGSANAGLTHGTRIHARQSNIHVDTRTPTAYGDLTTFVLVDFFGQNVVQAENQSNTQNARVVYAYGTLGPFLAGQWVSLFADTDAITESVDPTGHVGALDGLSNRSPQFRYTFAAPGGFSAAVSIENPEAEGFNGATGGPFTTNGAGSLGGVDRYPDVIGRVRLDQAWGHVAVSALYRDLKIEAPATSAAGAASHSGKSSYGAQLSGHLNTFGKDSLKWTVEAGKGLGHYMANFRDTVANGLVIDPATGAVRTPYAYGINVGYTHWWTGALRSSLSGGYEKNSTETGIVTTAAAANGYDKRHYEARANLIWSPVPQVDLGVEYIWARRVTAASTATVADTGTLNRVEVESVFKF
jgi:hypothetical protein